MLNLALTTDKLQLITSAAGAVDVHASFVDLAGTAVTPGRQNTAITTASTTDILAAPAASTFRNLKLLTVRNKAAVSINVTLLFNQNATLFELHLATLSPGDILCYVEGVAPVVIPATSARQSILTADQAVPVALTLVSNSVLDATALKVGTTLRWLLTMSKTAAGLATQTFDVRFGTAGSTADTVRLSTGFATGTQTGVADVAEVEVRCVIRTLGATGIAHGSFELQHNLAATGFAPTANVLAQHASAAFDLTVASLKASLCTTPGTAAAVTIHQVLAERVEP